MDVTKPYRALAIIKLHTKNLGICVRPSGHKSHQKECTSQVFACTRAQTRTSIGQAPSHICTGCLHISLSPAWLDTDLINRLLSRIPFHPSSIPNRIVPLAIPRREEREREREKREIQREREEARRRGTRKPYQPLTRNVHFWGYVHDVCAVSFEHPFCIHS